MADDLVLRLTREREYLARNLAAYDCHFLDKKDCVEQRDRWLKAAQEYVEQHKW